MAEALLSAGGAVVIALVALVVLCGRSPRGVDRLERLITAWRRSR